jgi:hypothetical protein
MSNYFDTTLDVSKISHIVNCLISEFSLMEISCVLILG